MRAEGPEYKLYNGKCVLRDRNINYIMANECWRSKYKLYRGKRASVDPNINYIVENGSSFAILEKRIE